MERFLRGFSFFLLITLSVFLVCAQRDNQFDPSSPGYIGTPPVLKIAYKFESDGVLRNVNDSEFVVRPHATVFFRVGSYDAETEKPLSVGLKIKDSQNSIVGSFDDISNEDSVYIPIGDSGKVTAIFTTKDQNNLITEKIYIFTVPSKPLIVVFGPIVKEENIVWVGRRVTVDFRTEISDPDLFLDSISYLLADIDTLHKSDPLPDTIVYLPYDSVIVKKKITNCSPLYIDTVSLECFSNEAGAKYVIASTTDKLGRNYITNTLVYFNDVDLQHYIEIKDIISTYTDMDSSIVCFKPDVSTTMGDLSKNTLYIYDYGDGFIDTVKHSNQCYAYTRPGSYSAKLTVIDGGASDTFSKIIDIRKPLTTKTVKINKLVSAPDSGCMPLKVNFVLVLLPGANEKDIKSIYWNFGDFGSYSSSGSLEKDHTYDRVGKFVVKVRITTLGEPDSAYDTVRVYPQYIHYSPKWNLHIGDTARFWLENYNPPFVKQVRLSVADTVANLKLKDTLVIFIKPTLGIVAEFKDIPEGSDVPYPWSKSVESINIIVVPKQDN
jgi:PKD repeat protein